jgi:hypothetical protein
MAPAWKGVAAGILTGVTGASKLPTLTPLLAALVPLELLVAPLLLLEEPQHSSTSAGPLPCPVGPATLSSLEALVS